MVIYDLEQDGIIVASVDAPTEEQAQKEIGHYALMYSQDGEVKIIKRKEHKIKMAYAKSLQGNYWNNFTLNKRKELLGQYFKTKRLVEKYSKLQYYKLPNGFKKYLIRKLEKRLQIRKY